MSKKLFGVITAMTTPFTAAGDVDVEALEQQTEFLINKGVDCLYPCGTTGEMYLMTSQARRLVAKTVVETANGRLPVFIHCGAMHMHDVMKLAHHAADIGADGVGIVTPSYFSISDTAMVEYYRSICTTLPEDFPIYAYAIPQLAKNDISYDCMRMIADACPNIVGIKYSYPDMRQMIEYTKIRQGDFSVVFGADDLFFPALTMGCAGTVSGCSSCIPEPFVNVYKYYIAGDYDKAREEQIKCFDIAQILRWGSNLSIFKNVQTIRGIRGGHVKAPLLDMSEKEVEQLRHELAPYL